MLVFNKATNKGENFPSHCLLQACQASGPGALLGLVRGVNRELGWDHNLLPLAAQREYKAKQ